MKKNWIIVIDGEERGFPQKTEEEILEIKKKYEEEEEGHTCSEPEVYSGWMPDDNFPSPILREIDRLSRM